jgi:hypothetical protein
MPAIAPASLDLLEREITTRYGCKSIPVRRELVNATVGQKSVVLRVTRFELLGHESAEHCFAWSMPANNGREKVITMLESAPILTAEDAVWARLNYEDGQ